jgi:hypothetical protein
VNDIAKNGGWLSSEQQSTGFRREIRVSWTAAIIVWLGGYFHWSEHSFDREPTDFDRDLLLFQS